MMNTIPGQRKQSAISISSVTSASQPPQPLVPEPSSSVYNECSQDGSFQERNESEPETVRVSPKKRIESYLASAGLVLGSAAASNTDPESANDHIQIWTTRISSRRSDYEYSTSVLASILGQDKYRSVIEMVNYAKTVSRSEQCFFCLLLLVTCIYAIGILTALILLCFHMWILKLFH